MSDPTFRFDDVGVNLVDKKMKDALAKSVYVLQDEIREAQVIPRMLGTLQGEAFTIIDKSHRKFMDMAFSTPYARRLYFHPEYNFHREPWTDAKGNTYEGNPNAKGKWLEDWCKGGVKEHRLSEIYEGVLKL